MTHEDITEIIASPVARDSHDNKHFLTILEEETTVSLKRIYLEDFSSPMTLSEVQRDLYLRRFNTLFIDSSRMREGSTSNILYATNAFGEHFALKARKIETLGSMDDEAKDRVEIVDYLFEREYEAHRMLAGIKGYPKLFGKARLYDRPVLVMEWIEGEDLLRAKTRMSIDDFGRLSPLTAARLGRDIFDVLARTSVLDSEIGHGDISLRNIMIDTSRQSVDEQMQEGMFDIRLIDLSSADVSSNETLNEDEENDQRHWHAATPEFAAPELRPSVSIPESTSANHLASADTANYSKCTQASDVYAVASILCLLAYGEPSPRFVTSQPKSAHDGDNDLFGVLSREPEVGVALHRTISELESAPSDHEISEVLSQVDEPMMSLLRSCLLDDPKKRPSAEEMHDALESFCASYTSNIARAMCGEVLEPCQAPFINKGVKQISLRARNLIRTFGKSLSLGLGTAVIATMAILLLMKPLTFDVDVLRLDGIQSELLVLLLFLPGALGILLRGRRRDSLTSLVRGSVGIVLGVVLLVLLINNAVFEPEAYEETFRWAIFAVAAMSWCPFVLDSAFPLHAPRVFKRSHALPERSSAKRLPRSLKTKIEPVKDLQLESSADSKPENELYDGADEPRGSSFQEGVQLHDER